MDVYEWARQGNQSQVADGERAMALHLERAQFAYDNNYDLPDAPPDVAVFVDSDENGNNAITWSDRAEKSPDPDYTGDEALDVQGYRVYRTQNNHLGPWELVADIPKGTTPSNTEYAPNTPWTSPTISYADGGTYTYRDVESVPGFRYWYSVRTYDSGHSDWNGTGRAIPSLESGHSAPEQRMNVSRSPIVIATPEKDALSEQVRVVPNPFRDDPGDADHRYPPASNNIRFVNIPPKSKNLHLFNLRRFGRRHQPPAAHYRPRQGRSHLGPAHAHIFRARRRRTLLLRGRISGCWRNGQKADRDVYDHQIVQRRNT